MRILLVVSNYPHAGHPYSGAFNERSAQALKALGHQVEVLAPRPFVPRALAAWHPRWRAYDQIVEQDMRDGLRIYRPAYIQLPGLGAALRPDFGAYLSCARSVKLRHQNNPYHAIVAFNLIGAGGLAWRLARRLGIPAAGWATGNDVRVPSGSAQGRTVRAALERLDLVCYQSSELVERAAALCQRSTEDFSDPRHVVLARGIEPAPPRSGSARRALRASLNLGPEQLVVLFVGRIAKAKGVFDLLEAVERVRQQQPNVVCLFLGAHDGFDESRELRERLERVPQLVPHVRVLPGCPPEEVWRYLNAADIFAFPSYSEGMPNSLLEAMASGLPSLVYAIPPMLEIDNHLGALMMVPPRDVDGLARALGDLARSALLRRQIGKIGQTRVLRNYLARASMAEAVLRLSALRKRAGNPSPLSDPARCFPTGSAGSGVSSKSP